MTEATYQQQQQYEWKTHSAASIEKIKIFSSVLLLQ